MCQLAPADCCTICSRRSNNCLQWRSAGVLQKSLPVLLLSAPCLEQATLVYQASSSIALFIGYRFSRLKKSICEHLCSSVFHEKCKHSKDLLITIRCKSSWRNLLARSIDP